MDQGEGDETAGGGGNVIIIDLDRFESTMIN